MQHLFLLALGLLGSLSLWAQSPTMPLRIFDQKGQEIKDGSTLLLDHVETDDWGDVAIHSGISVENTSNEELHLGVDVDLKRIDCGEISFCFPIDCRLYDRPKKASNGEGSLKPNEKNNIQLEWFPQPDDADAEIPQQARAEMSFTLQWLERSGTFPRYTYSPKAQGPTLHLLFVYKDPAGIAHTTSQPQPTALYDLAGKRMSAGLLPPGTYIQQWSNGESRKIIVR